MGLPLYDGRIQICFVNIFDLLNCFRRTVKQYFQLLPVVIKPILFEQDSQFAKFHRLVSNLFDFRQISLQGLLRFLHVLQILDLIFDILVGSVTID